MSIAEHNVAGLERQYVVTDEQRQRMEQAVLTELSRLMATQHLGRYVSSEVWRTLNAASDLVRDAVERWHRVR